MIYAPHILELRWKNHKIDFTPTARSGVTVPIGGLPIAPNRIASKDIHQEKIKGDTATGSRP